MYWFYVLPLGFLLTMYTITGYDASAHLSEETHGASMSSAKGLWRSVFYAAIVGYIVLLALTFAATHTKIVDTERISRARDHRECVEHRGSKGRDPHLDGRPAALRHRVRHERVTDDLRLLARRRDPGPQPLASAGGQQDPDVVGAVRGRVGDHHHDSGVLPELRRLPGRVLRGHLGVGHRPLHRLHDPGLPALENGIGLRARPVDPRQQVQVAERHRHRVGCDLRDRVLAAVHSGGRAVADRLQLGTPSTTRR